MCCLLSKEINHVLHIYDSVFPFVHYHDNCNSETASINKGNTGWWQGVGAFSVFMFVLKDQCSHGEAGLFFFNVIPSYPRLHYFKRKKKVILILGICWCFSKCITAFSCYCLFWQYLTLEFSITQFTAGLAGTLIVWFDSFASIWSKLHPSNTV